jgi:cystathionine gamma-synthase
MSDLFTHDQLSETCESKFGLENEQCILFPKASIASHCRDFLMAQCLDPDAPPTVRIVQFLVHSDSATVPSSSGSNYELALHIVLFPTEVFPIAKQFWQHTGLGISSRMAARCLALLENNVTSPSGQTVNQPPTSPTRLMSRNKHYTTKASSSRGGFVSSTSETSQRDPDRFSTEQVTYLEERYGRNMPLTDAAIAKRTLRRRIAGVLTHEGDSSPTGTDALQPSTRGVEGVTEDNVYLYPTGMSAIWNAHQLCLKAFPPENSVCFGYVTSLPPPYRALTWLLYSPSLVFLISIH